MYGEGCGVEGDREGVVGWTRPPPPFPVVKIVQRYFANKMRGL